MRSVAVSNPAFRTGVFLFLYDFGRLLSVVIYGTVGVEGAYIRIWPWSDNRDKVSLLKCY